MSHKRPRLFLIDSAPETAAALRAWLACSAPEIVLEETSGAAADLAAQLMMTPLRAAGAPASAVDPGVLQASILENLLDAVIVTDPEGHVIYWNDGAAQMFGYGADEMLGQTPAALYPGTQRAGFALDLHRVLAGHDWTGEWRGQGKTGAEVWAKLRVTRLTDTAGSAIGAIAVGQDITERKRAEDRLSYLAHHDGVTGLPNRVLLLDRLAEELKRAPWRHRLLGVLVVGLDRFQAINEMHGPPVGDLALRAAGERLLNAVRAGDTVARLHGDEFAVALTDLAQPEDLPAIARKIVDAVAQPITLGAHALRLTASVGISLYPTDADNPETLLRNASAAMASAKDAGRNTFQHYSTALNSQAAQRHEMERELRAALERGEFVLHYQPQIDLQTGRATGAEALLRWAHPQRGLVPPLQFIPLAEDTGLIAPIGEWVLRTACRQARAWRDAGLGMLRIAVNLSARQVHRGDLLAVIGTVLRDTQLEPGQLELEFTESLLIDGHEEVLLALNEFNALGIQLAIDDFGTGYSSLSYLKRFPITKVKIDQSFVRNIAIDTDDAAIVRAIITMAQTLNLRTIAEGVETAEQLRLLTALGCDEAQGFFIGRPVPAEEFMAWLKQRPGSTAP